LFGFEEVFGRKEREGKGGRKRMKRWERRWFKEKVVL
jgi:hypothetical protein